MKSFVTSNDSLTLPEYETVSLVDLIEDWTQEGLSAAKRLKCNLSELDVEVELDYGCCYYEGDMPSRMVKFSVRGRK